MVLNEDWDILILLDACRYKEFEDVNYLNGKLKKINGGCRNTKEWLMKNLYNKNCSDIIYVNPIISLKEWLPNTKFYKVINIWEKKWNSNYGTILPEEATETALKEIKQNPNKRMIIHYMQPHIPFLDESPTIVKSKTREQTVKSKGIDGKISVFINKLKMIFPSLPFWYLERTFGNNAGVGEIYFKRGFKGMKESYKSNLLRVLKNIEEVVKETDKKIVITSDHGEFLGEMGMFGHGFWKNDVITNVPWFIVED